MIRGARLPAVVAVSLAAGACSRGEDRLPMPIPVPAGTEISVVLDQALTTRIHRAGDPFVATVREAVAVDGRIAIAAGASLRGRVEEAESGSRAGTPRLTLGFTAAVGPDGTVTPLAVRPVRLEGAPGGATESIRSPVLGDEIGGGLAPVAVAVSDANEIELPIGQRLALEIASVSPVAAGVAPGS